MTNDDICGYPTAAGHDCQHPACRPDGRCWQHTEAKPRANGGQPTKLNDERIDSITTAVAEGKSITSAARMAGINRVTVYNWLERGESEKQGPFREFFNAIERARGHGEDFYFDTAMDLAIENGDHRFIASLMKQRYGESWGEADMGVDAERTVIELPESVTNKWQRQAE